MELVNWTGGWVEGLMLGGVHGCTGGHGIFDGSMDVDGVMLGGIHNAMGGRLDGWVGGLMTGGLHTGMVISWRWPTGVQSDSFFSYMMPGVPVWALSL